MCKELRSGMFVYLNLSNITKLHSTYTICDVFNDVLVLKGVYKRICVYTNLCLHNHAYIACRVWTVYCIYMHRLLIPIMCIITYTVSTIVPLNFRYSFIVCTCDCMNAVVMYKGERVREIHREGVHLARIYC